MSRPETGAGPRIAYFAHDWGDAAIKRRLGGFARDGMRVAGLAMHRAEGPRPDWVVADLGRTFDGRYLQRALAIGRGARAAQVPELASADLIVARNLDMLLVAIAARRRARLNTPIVYECLDIHRLVARTDRLGRLFRRIERRALDAVAGVWISSPAFAERHFTRYYPGGPALHLVENRLQSRPGPRPVAAARSGPRPGEPLRIGWFGNLRCARSLAMLCGIAEDFGDRVEIVLRGYPALTEIPDFDAIVAAQPRLRVGGRYRWPEDLADIYGSVDLVWAGDFMDAGLNSDWLLPNRLYEGGWYGCPPIAPVASETGRWIAAKDCGLVLAGRPETALAECVAALLADPGPIAHARQRLLSLPEEALVEPAGLLGALAREAMAAPARGRAAGRRMAGVSTAPQA